MSFWVWAHHRFLKAVVVIEKFSESCSFLLLPITSDFQACHLHLASIHKSQFYFELSQGLSTLAFISAALKNGWGFFPFFRRMQFLSASNFESQKNCFDFSFQLTFHIWPLKSINPSKHFIHTSFMLSRIWKRWCWALWPAPPWRCWGLRCSRCVASPSAFEPSSALSCSG